MKPRLGPQFQRPQPPACIPSFALHLFALHPGKQITAIGTPDLAAAAKRTLQLRGDDGTGWSIAWKENFWHAFMTVTMRTGCCPLNYGTPMSQKPSWQTPAEHTSLSYPFQKRRNDIGPTCRQLATVPYLVSVLKQLHSVDGDSLFSRFEKTLQ